VVECNYGEAYFPMDYWFGTFAATEEGAAWGCVARHAHRVVHARGGERDARGRKVHREHVEAVARRARNDAQALVRLAYLQRHHPSLPLRTAPARPAEFHNVVKPRFSSSKASKAKAT
jgi:hypothetical protein